MFFAGLRGDLDDSYGANPAPAMGRDLLSTKVRLRADQRVAGQETFVYTGFAAIADISCHRQIRCHQNFIVLWSC